MKNRVYGLIGIECRMANWNADFTGRPKSISNGDIFGSDKAIKFPMKRYWLAQGEKVLYVKSYKAEKDKIQPKDLSERYEEIYEDQIGNQTQSKEVLANLFSAIDVMNFGATFAVSKQNISITGAVQIGQGFNLYEGATVEIQDILSPFRNSNRDAADASSLGKKIVLSEAHYMYPFSINPQNYDEYIEIVDEFEGYTKEAYNKFKDAALIGATAFNTNSKNGCNNEFALFVECKKDSNLYLPNLDQYVSFDKQEKNMIDLSALEEILNQEAIQCQIESIEVYYNPYTTNIKGNLKDAVMFNIFTKEEHTN